MKTTKEKQQWEEIKNITQKKIEKKPSKDGIEHIIGKTKKESIIIQKNDIGKIRARDGRFSIINLTGQIFGRLKVIKFIGIKNNQTFWECRCECTNIKNINGNLLKIGKTKSCGCLAGELIKKRHFNNRESLTGKKFNKFTVLEISINKHYGRILWKCQCDCGKIKDISTYDLKNGKTKSCGCLKKEVRTAKSESGFNGLFGSYISQEKYRNIEFKLTKEQFSGLTKQNCYYCGVEPKQIRFSGKNKETIEWSKYIYNGIDRKNNSKGYIMENCVGCCGVCNKLKRNMIYCKFIEQIKKIYEYTFDEH